MLSFDYSFNVLTRANGYNKQKSAFINRSITDQLAVFDDSLEYGDFEEDLSDETVVVKLRQRDSELTINQQC